MGREDNSSNQNKNGKFIVEKRNRSRKKLPPVLGAFVSAGDEMMVPAHIQDISPEGIALNILYDPEKFKAGTITHVRMYFSNTAFISVGIKINNVIPKSEKKCKIGASFVHDGLSSLALEYFSQFLEMISKTMSENQISHKRNHLKKAA